MHLHPSPLVHLTDQSVDVVLTIAQITAFDEVLELPRPEASRGVGQLERPKEVADLLEVGPNRVDLVDDVFHAHDAILPQLFLDDGIVRERDALLVAVQTLVACPATAKTYTLPYPRL
jgi:hypothetical protein